MSQSRALLLAVSAYFIWVLSDVCLKFGAQSGLPILVSMLLFGGVGVVYYPAAVFLKHRRLDLKPHCTREVLGISACSIGINFFNIIALARLPLTVFYTIVFTIPLIIAVLSALLKYEILTPTKIACVIVGFIGTAIAIGFKSGGGGDLLGYVTAFLGVGCFCATTLLMRRIGKKDSAESIQFWRLLAVFCTAAIGIAATGTEVSLDKAFFIMSVSATLGMFGTLVFNFALQNTASTNVVQFHYTQIIYGAVFGYLFWDEIPTWNLVLGSVLIIASGLVVAAETRRLERAGGPA